MAPSLAANFAVALAASAFSPAVLAQTGPITAADITGGFREPDVSVEQQDAQEVVPGDFPQPEAGEVLLVRNVAKKVGNLITSCGCSNSAADFEPIIEDIRDVSNTFLSGGTAKSSPGLTNMVWSWGQFMDHDLVATIDQEADTPGTVKYDITLENGPSGPVDMTVVRLVASNQGKCRIPIAANTPIIDGGVLYGADNTYLNNVIRQPNSCMLRSSPGNLLPVTSEPEVTEQSTQWFFIAGDLRVNEHAVLTTMHTIWMREHNRLCGVVNNSNKYGNLSNDKKFQLVRKVVVAKLQQITVNEFLPTLGISPSKLRTWKPETNSAAISTEFATAGYRFGHDMVPDTLGSFKTVEIFQGEEFFGIESAAGSKDPAAANAKMESLIQAVASNTANEIDGKLSDTLRNTLFGAFGEDLASRNIFRGRELGLKSYADMAKCFGTKPSLPKSVTVDDSFVGILKENKLVGVKPLGNLATAIITDQFHRILFGEKGKWWGKKPKQVKGFLNEVQTTKLKDVIEANTGLNLPANIWKK